MLALLVRISATSNLPSSMPIRETVFPGNLRFHIPIRSISIFFAATGDRWGQYRILIDGVDCGVSDWFIDWPWGPVGRSSYDLEPHLLKAGQHILTCICEGRDSAAVEYSFGPDALTVTPLGSLLSNLPSASLPTSSTKVYPNPGNSATLYLIPSNRDNNSSAHYRVILFDMLGRSLGELYQGMTDANGKLSLQLPRLPSGSYMLQLADGVDPIELIPVVHLN